MRGGAPLRAELRGSVDSGGFGGLDAHAVTECLDLAGEATNVRFGPALLEPVGPEVLVGDAVGENVPGGDEDRVSDGLVGPWRSRWDR